MSTITIGKFIKNLDDAVSEATQNELGEGITYDTEIEFFFGKPNDPDKVKLQPDGVGLAETHGGKKVLFLTLEKYERGLNEMLEMLKNIMGDERFAEIHAQAKKQAVTELGITEEEFDQRTGHHA